MCLLKTLELQICNVYFVKHGLEPLKFYYANGSLWATSLKYHQSLDGI